MSEIFVGTHEEYNPIMEEQTEFVPQEIQMEEIPIVFEHITEEQTEFVSQEIQTQETIIECYPMATEGHYEHMKPVWKGDYNEDESYTLFNLIRFAGGIYCCMSGNLRGIQPVEGKSTSNWSMVISPNELNN